MLANKELNDTATSEFIEAESLKGEGRKNEARNKYGEIAREYKNAYCWDPRGWYWNVAEVAQDKLDTMDTKYDYGDYRSETLTVKAWNSLKEKDHQGIDLYAKKCIKLYEKKARAMKAGLTAPPAKEAAFNNWALNDVATCYYIQGERYLSTGNQEKAKEMFGQAAELGFAVCWDPKGWHWNVAEVAKDKLSTIGTKYEYGDYKSETLTTKAWKALEGKDPNGVDLYTKKCIYLFEKEANNMKTKVTADPAEGQETQNWAMNDVATCYYLQGERLRNEGKTAEAKQLYGKVKEFEHAVCWNPKGWFFKVSEAAQDRLDTMGTKYDYEDYKSETLIRKSWEALIKKDYKGVEMYAQKNIKIYEEEAIKMQILKQRSPIQEPESLNWALNDVATCYYLLGEINLIKGNDKKAKEMYGKAAQFGFALCWDPQGWYFKVGETAKDRLDLWGTSYNFGDYRSVTLTTKAWQALNKNDYKGVELYAKKCVYLYEDKAKLMQGELSTFAKSGFAPMYWALNDVGTCYFILGESYQKQGNVQKAREAYQTAIDQYRYAQCWDTRGWYWKISVVAENKLNEIQ
jgi:tetratricopeptide (TPR) repeat protein